MRLKRRYIALLLGELAFLGLAMSLLFLFNDFYEPFATPKTATIVPEIQVQAQAASAEAWPALPELATFGNRVKLLNVNLPALRFLPGNVIEATLFWQTQPLTASYTIFLRLVDLNDNLISQVDLALSEANCAKSSQLSSNIIVTCAALPLPDRLAAGEYRLVILVYDPSSGQWLATAEGASQYFLEVIEVAEW